MKLSNHDKLIRAKTNITKEFLRVVLRYDPFTGGFTWTKDRPYGVKAGERADRPHPKGYRVISLHGTTLLAHHVAWCYMHGEMPKMLDHKNMVRDDNRLDNLRLATPSQQRANTGLDRRNRIGYKGVYASGKKYAARIAGKYLGTFENIDDAVHTYRLAAVDLYGEFARAA